MTSKREYRDDREKEIVDYLQRLNKCERESFLGGMAWDEVNWQMYYLSNDYGWSKEDFAKEFPALTGNGKYLV